MQFRFVLLMFVCGNLCAQAVASQADTPPATSPFGWLEESEPAYDLAQAESWRDAVLPAVERAAGRSFTVAPRLSIVTRQQMMDSLSADALAVLMTIAPNADPDELELAIALDHLQLAPGLAGRYSRLSNTIELPAGNISPLMKASRQPAEHLDSIMKLVVAHELAHVLHHQHVQVSEQINDLRTASQARAFTATTEGFAMFIQGEVARELGLDDAQSRLLDLMTMRKIRSAPGRAQRLVQELYFGGMRFMQAQHAEGGLERVWSILAAPPLTYAQVREPSTYGQPVERRLHVGPLFHGINDALGGGSRNIMPRPLTADAVARTFTPLGPAAADEIVELIDGAWALMLQGDNQEMCNITLIRSGSEEKATVMLDRFGQLADRQLINLQRMGAQSQFEVTANTDLQVGNLLADEIRSFRFGIQAPDGQGPAIVPEIIMVAARRGDTTAQFVGSNTAVTNDQIAAVMDMTFTRLASGAAMLPVEPVDPNDLLQATAGRIRMHLDNPDAWAEEHPPVGSNVVSRLGGDDIEAHMLEQGYNRGRSVMLSRRDRAGGQLLMLTVVHMSDEDHARRFHDKAVIHIDRPFDQYRQMPNTQVLPEIDEQRELDDGTTLTIHRVRISMMGQPSSPATVHIALHGKYVVYMLDVQGALPADRVEMALQDVIGGLVE